MGGKFKNQGSLRDFRVDTVTGAKPHSNTAERPTQAQVQSRQKFATEEQLRSSVEEWDREAFAEDAQDLWKTWENDLDALEKNTLSQAALQSQREESQTVQPIEESIDSPASQEPKSNSSLHNKATVPWAADLAITERRMERRGEVEYSTSFKKQELLKSQTAEFMQVLRSEFGRHIDLFNGARHSSSYVIHLYKVSNSENDFMLFRNGVKLIVSGERSGRILFSFNQFMGQVFNPGQSPQFELEAAWGPFERLFWSYQGERVQVQDVVRYFVSEFARQSYK